MVVPLVWLLLSDAALKLSPIALEAMAAFETILLACNDVAPKEYTAKPNTDAFNSV